MRRAIWFPFLILSLPFITNALMATFEQPPGCPTAPPICKSDETMYARGDQTCFYSSFFCKKTPPAPASPSPARATTVSSAAKPSFTSSSSAGLQFGARGSRVSALQQLLALDPAIYPEGLVTGYFGALTRAAIWRVQEATGVATFGNESSTGYGRVGPRTILAMQSYPWVRIPRGGSVASLLQQLGATNNSNINTGAPAPAASAVSNVTNISSAQGLCIFNGISIPHGSSRIFFDTPLVSSGEQCSNRAVPRTCLRGELSGTEAYRYTNCSPTITNTPATVTCFLGSASVADGASQTFYNAGIVESLNQAACLTRGQTRTCTRGTLSGDTAYHYVGCTVVQPVLQVLNSCIFNGVSISHNQSLIAYQYPSAAGSACVSETRTCYNGALSGSYVNGTCSTQGTSSCSWNGQVIQSGQSATAYQSTSVSFGSQCISEQRACSNGSLTGSYLFDSCTATTGASCTFNGQTVAHGASVTSYQSPSVAYGNQCVSENRTCSNGTLSGTYVNASCSVATGASCTTYRGVFPEATIADGQTSTFYSWPVTSGQSCSSVSQSRKCSNGVLTGDPLFCSLSCSVGGESGAAYCGEGGGN